MTVHRGWNYPCYFLISPYISGEESDKHVNSQPSQRLGLPSIFCISCTDAFKAGHDEIRKINLPSEDLSIISTFPTTRPRCPQAIGHTSCHALQRVRV